MPATDVDVLKVARDAGLTILLDGRIGSVEYQSVSGSAEALEKFAIALRDPPPGTCRRVRAARSPSVNPLIPARMRERIAADLYRKNGAARSWHGRREKRALSAKRRAV
jgi:hypothetical protein